MVACIMILIIFKELNALQMAIFLVETFITLYICTKGRTFTAQGKNLKAKIVQLNSGINI